MKFITRIYTILAIVFITTANADKLSVFKATVDKPMSYVYSNVYHSLEEARFFVVFEPNIGKNLSGFSERWGEDYNRNELSEIRSMVFCNAWYANQVSNKDPDMLGFCPLHLTLIEKQGKTTALFNRPTALSIKSPAHDLFQEIEDTVIKAVEKGMKK